MLNLVLDDVLGTLRWQFKVSLFLLLVESDCFFGVHSGVIWHASFILFSNWFNAVFCLKRLSS